MIPVLIFIAIVAALAVGAGWLADRPGEIALTWQGYEFRTSLLVGLGAVAVFSLVFALVWGGFGALIALPGRISRRRAERRRARGLLALSRGMIAVGAGDRQEAHRQSVEAGRLIGEMPLARLLLAQEAQLAGDGPRAAALFRAMADEEATRLIGLRGLFIEARRQGDAEAARHYAEAALAASKGLPWAGNAVLEFQAAEHDWPAALATLAAVAEAGGIERARARHLRAVLLTAQALELEPGDPEQARGVALEAHQIAPDLVAAATAAGRLLVRADEFKRATRLLEKAWKETQHPEIAEAYGELRPGDSVRDRLGRIERLNQIHPNSREGALALARAAIDAREWTMARQALAAVLRDAPSERACLLMAEIEEGDDADAGRVREWLSRALKAPRDPAWVADGQVFSAWAPVSPVSGRLDAFEWKVPAQPPGARLAPELVFAAMPAAGTARVNADTMPSSTADEPLELTPEPPARPAEAKRAAVEAPDDTVGPTGQPDDPGPEPEPEAKEEAPTARRFGLF